MSIRLDGTHLDIATTTTGPGVRGAGLPTVIARHLAAPTGAGVMVRDHGHVTALNQAAMNGSSSAGPHRSKQRLPPSPTARAHAAALRTGTGVDGDAVVNLAQYAAAAAGRNTLRAHRPPQSQTRTEAETHTAPKESPRPPITIKENPTA